MPIFNYGNGHVTTLVLHCSVESVSYSFSTSGVELLSISFGGRPSLTEKINNFGSTIMWYFHVQARFQEEDSLNLKLGGQRKALECMCAYNPTSIHRFSSIGLPRPVQNGNVGDFCTVVQSRPEMMSSTCVRSSCS